MVNFELNDVSARSIRTLRLVVLMPETERITRLCRLALLFVRDQLNATCGSRIRRVPPETVSENQIA